MSQENVYIPNLVTKKTSKSIVNYIKDEILKEVDLSGSGGLELGDIGQDVFPIDENQMKRRYLNGQTILIEQYSAFLTKLKSAVELYPSLACTEAEWQEIATKSAVGQCGKFVIDESAGTIRLPKIVMPIQGLIDLASLGEIVDAGLPNITGKIQGNNYETLIPDTFQVEGALNIEKKLTVIYASTSGSSALSTSAITFDASKSNPIYGNSETVQPEAIQYPYFIQVAIGVEETPPAEKELTLNNPYSLLEHKIVDCKLNNTSWLRSEGQFNSGDVYSDAYNLLLSELSNKTRDFSIKTTDEAYTDYDFVLNTTDKTFRLPLFTSERQLVEKKEPTKKDPSWYNLYSDGWLEQGGTFAQTSINNAQQIDFLKSFKTPPTVLAIVSKTASSIGNEGCVMVYDKNKTSFKIWWFKNASDSFDWSSQGYTSEKPASASNLYYYVGDTVQNASLINAGRIEEKIIDISTNLIPDKSELITNYCIPDYSSEMTVSNLPYTAPFNGLFKHHGVLTGGDTFIYIDGIEVSRYGGGASAGFDFYYFVKKGSIITKSGNAISGMKFYPLKGVNQNA